MADVFSDQLSIVGGGTASAGLGGSSQQTSPTENDSPVRFKRFTFTIPAAGAGSANGDRIKVARLNVFDRFISARAIITAAGGLGAATTLSIGKIDTNLAANTDNVHYSAAKNTAAPAVIDADTNITEQVGAAPTGAVTDSGQGLTSQPGGGYGEGPIDVTLVIGGGAPAAGVQIQGYVFYAGSR